jgi:hypothetical protein
MNNEYFDHIISDKKTCRFLHRTSENLVNKILKEGLLCSCGDLTATATFQPDNPERAMGMYLSGYPERTAAVIIGLPNGSFKKASEAGLTRSLAYFHPIKKQFTIRPEFIEGWIDRKINRYFPNPFVNRRPIEGFEEFDYFFD